MQAHDDNRGAAEEIPSAGAAPTRRRRRWLRVVLLVALLPIAAVGGLLVYVRMTALSSPPSLAALFPDDTLIYLEIDDVGDLLERAKRLRYIRESAWLDAEGRPRAALPEALPIDDAKSLDEEHDRITELRRTLSLAPYLKRATLAAGRLPSDDPESDIWLLAAKLDSTAAETLVGGIEALLWLTRRGQAHEHLGATVTVYRDKKPKDAVQLLRLGDTVVMLFGTDRTATLDALIERYDATMSGGISDTPFSKQVTAARNRLQIAISATPSPSDLSAARPLLVAFSQGALLREHLLPHLRHFIDNREPSDAEDDLQLIDSLGPFTTAAFDVRLADGGLWLDGLGVPDAEAYRRIRGHGAADAGAIARPPFAHASDAGGDDAVAAADYIGGEGNVARVVAAALRDLIDLEAPGDAGGHESSRDRRLEFLRQRYETLVGDSVQPSNPLESLGLAIGRPVAAVTVVPALPAAASYRQAVVRGVLNGGNAPPAHLSQCGEGGDCLVVEVSPGRLRFAAGFRGEPPALGASPESIPVPPSLDTTRLARVFPAPPSRGSTRPPRATTACAARTIPRTIGATHGLSPCWATWDSSPSTGGLTPRRAGRDFA